MENSTVAKTARRNNKGYTVFRSKDGTKPLNQLTEKQRIQEGSRQPHFVKPDFSKSKEEKESLKVLKRREYPAFVSGGLFETVQPRTSRVTVHLKNESKSNMFKTTHTFDSYSPQNDAAFIAERAHSSIVGMYIDGKKVK